MGGLMKSVSVLLIGLGRVGSRFYEKFRSLGEEKVRILGVCEQNRHHGLLSRVEKDGVPIYPDPVEAIRSLGEKTDIVLDTSNVPSLKHDLREALKETENHHTVLLPLVVSYLLWHMSQTDEEIASDHIDSGY